MNKIVISLTWGNTEAVKNIISRYDINKTIFIFLGHYYNTDMSLINFLENIPHKILLKSKFEDFLIRYVFNLELSNKIEDPVEFWNLIYDEKRLTMTENESKTIKNAIKYPNFLNQIVKWYIDDENIIYISNINFTPYNRVENQPMIMQDNFKNPRDKKYYYENSFYQKIVTIQYPVQDLFVKQNNFRLLNGSINNVISYDVNKDKFITENLIVV